MIIYLIDNAGVYTGPCDLVDVYAPLPPCAMSAPPITSGPEVARWSMGRWEVLPEYPQPAPASDHSRIASLWQAAHDYEYAQVSGSAIGLLAIGVMQAKPKCIAVQAWIKSIWDVYYARKAGASTDTDYSMVGLMPHTVPELMTELGL